MWQLCRGVYVYNTDSVLVEIGNHHFFVQETNKLTLVGRRENHSVDVPPNRVLWPRERHRIRRYVARLEVEDTGEITKGTMFYRSVYYSSWLSCCSSAVVKQKIRSWPCFNKLITLGCSYRHSFFPGNCAHVECITGNSDSVSVSPVLQSRHQLYP